ncbi:MAG: SDR family oxidoreductase [Candidatus Glassbacteria bacterium]
MTDGEFRGKVALVTGGTRGIGKAIAVRLAESGADVFITFFRSRDTAQKTVKEIEDLGVRCIAVRSNMRDRTGIVRLFERVREQYGRLDILVVNAAMAFFSNAMEFSESKWDVTIESNVSSYLAYARQAHGLMKSGGKIVAITSYGSRRYIPGYIAMGASKAAIESMTRYLAVEFAGSNINVNCVSGGPVETDSLRLIPQYKKLIEESIARTPLRRIGTPEDLAKVVAFLCSDDSEWVRGQNIIADGGMSLL